MKNKEFEELFITQLETMLGAEKQILDTLPKLIKLAEIEDLKNALSTHLEETENQVERLEQIFRILNITPQARKNIAMEGILKQGEELLKNKPQSPILDAAIIASAQMVEHCEIAIYGTLRSFAKHLKLDDEVADLLQETLKEEGAADKLLTKIADGSLFASGINEEAASG
ncbi:MAG: ferritin-like domain-containing protein [Parachlamydiaceae bacterium]|nr:ferritin-like domain-containing protein [Parachlamydiaceae bacterium]